MGMSDHCIIRFHLLEVTISGDGIEDIFPDRLIWTTVSEREIVHGDLAGQSVEEGARFIRECRFCPLDD